MSILDWGPIGRTRRNHALEHATLSVLAERIPHLRMGGYSDDRGFWLVGNVSTEAVLEAIQVALTRLEAGEHSLAIHPNCGTNFAAAGMLAGTMAWLGMMGVGRGWRSRLERWPMIVSLVTLAMIFAQPLGPWLQERITTRAALDGLQVVEIRRHTHGDLPVHRVLTRS